MNHITCTKMDGLIYLVMIYIVRLIYNPFNLCLMSQFMVKELNLLSHHKHIYKM